jgi:hypothetical protein
LHIKFLLHFIFPSLYQNKKKCSSPFIVLSRFVRAPTNSTNNVINDISDPISFSLLFVLYVKYKELIHIREENDIFSQKVLRKENIRGVDKLIYSEALLSWLLKFLSTLVEIANKPTKNCPSFLYKDTLRSNIVLIRRLF